MGITSSNLCTMCSLCNVIYQLDQFLKKNPYFILDIFQKKLSRQNSNFEIISSKLDTLKYSTRELRFPKLSKCLPSQVKCANI